MADEKNNSSRGSYERQSTLEDWASQCTNGYSGLDSSAASVCHSNRVSGQEDYYNKDLPRSPADPYYGIVSSGGEDSLSAIMEEAGRRVDLEFLPALQWPGNKDAFERMLFSSLAATGDTEPGIRSAKSFLSMTTDGPGSSFLAPSEVFIGPPEDRNDPSKSVCELYRNISILEADCSYVARRAGGNSVELPTPVDNQVSSPEKKTPETMVVLEVPPALAAIRLAIMGETGVRQEPVDPTPRTYLPPRSEWPSASRPGPRRSRFFKYLKRKFGHLKSHRLSTEGRFIMVTPRPPSRARSVFRSHRYRGGVPTLPVEGLQPITRLTPDDVLALPPSHRHSLARSGVRFRTRTALSRFWSKVRRGLASLECH